GQGLAAFVGDPGHLAVGVDGGPFEVGDAGDDVVGETVTGDLRPGVGLGPVDEGAADVRVAAVGQATAAGAAADAVPSFQYESAQAAGGTFASCGSAGKSGADDDDVIVMLHEGSSLACWAGRVTWLRWVRARPSCRAQQVIGPRRWSDRVRGRR